MSTAPMHRYRLAAGLRMIVAITLLALASGPASAQIDVSGRWKFTLHSNLAGSIDLPVSLVQTGATLTVVQPSYYIGGTIDPVTGAMHLDGHPGCAPSVPTTLDAVAAPDGSSFSGSFEESFRPTLSCLVHGGPAEGVRLPAICGNGFVDAGEACDGGPSGSACCDEFCTPRPAGTSCPVASLACAGSAQCDGAATCVQLPKAAGALCRFATDACDTPEVCDGTSFTCPPPTSPTEPDVDDDGVLDGCDFCLGAPLENVQLRFGRFRPGAWNFLKLRASVRLPPGTPFHNPEFEPQFLDKVVTLRDSTGAVIVEERIPGTTISGPPFEWKLKGTRWTFTNEGTPLTQVARMRMGPSRRDPNVWDVSVAIPRGVLPDDAGTPPYAVEVELYRTGFPSGDCGRLVFGPPGAPSPSCSAPNVKGVIRCR